MYICVYTCIYTHDITLNYIMLHYTHLCDRTHAHKDTHANTHTHHTHTHTTHTRTCARTHARKYVRTHARTQANTDARTRKDRSTRIHIPVHEYKPTPTDPHLFSCRFREGISLTNFVERSIL